jgi:flagellar basal body-associated protein FliL
MIRLFADSEKLPRVLYIVLLSLSGVLILLLIAGTVYGLVRSPNADPLFTLGKSGGTAADPRLDDIRVFPGVGRLRIPIANSSILILSIAFPYQAGDIAFTEELAGKTSELKAIAANYFSALPADKLIQIDEDAAKAEILRRFNAALRLGRIEALYFNDMMILDAGL